MIRLNDLEYGTAAEVAHALGADVTAEMIRNWARRDGLAYVTTRDDDGRWRSRYQLRQAALIEAQKRSTRRGRPRLLAPQAAATA